MTKLTALIVIATTLIVSSMSYAGPRCVPGVVIYVDDGDTAKVKKVNGEILNVRFYGIDSPEKKWPEKWPDQPFSGEAKSFMTKLILRQKVCVRLTGDSTHKRVVGEIFIKGKSASQSIVKAGLAWWNDKYAPTDGALKALQDNARARNVGLWSQARPEAPWDFRRRYRR